MSVNFYSSLFRYDPNANGRFISDLFPPIAEKVKSVLRSNYSMTKCQTTLNAMGSLKASGPDGFPPSFFMKAWEITGPTVYRFVHEVLDGSDVPKEAATALLVLIPKETKPALIRKY